jgi:hypothetical protein
MYRHKKNDGVTSDDSSGGLTAKDVVVEYTSSQSICDMLDICACSATEDRVYIAVTMQAKTLPSMARFMHQHGMNVFLEYTSPTGVDGWFFVVRSGAVDGPLPTPEDLTRLATELRVEGDASILTLPPKTSAINMTWTREVSFCDINIDAKTLLHCTLPSKLLTGLQQRPRAFTPEPSEVNDSMGWCEFITRLLILALTTVAVTVFGVVYFNI